MEPVCAVGLRIVCAGMAVPPFKQVFPLIRWASSEPHTYVIEVDKKGTWQRGSAPGQQSDPLLETGDKPATARGSKGPVQMCGEKP